ncbi:MAG TPA: protein phosphatase 2C domain-containing protein [Planctomycetaceae bacterium]|jgi:protein phosphatase|nr:protein phosphatase 2C domain-containing protein [Planctomycetaceae bacterium]
MTDIERETQEFRPLNTFGASFFAAQIPQVEVHVGAASHIGKVRSNNEDHFAVISRKRSQTLLMTNVPEQNFGAIEDEAYILVVADGMGGAQAGEWASRLALQAAWDLAGRASSWIMRFRDLEAQQAQARVDAYVQEIHQTLVDYGQADPELTGMGTTWTSAYIVGWDAVIMHIGDSRAYLHRRGSIQQITKDHTLAQALIDSGIPPEDTTRVRHVLTNSLGGRAEQLVSPDVRHVPLEDGDRLLLCTDGLSDLVSDSEIADEIVRAGHPQAACDALIELALARGGKDNVTVVLAQTTRLTSP